MFDIVSKSEVQPWVAFVIGFLFTVAISSWYRNDCSLTPYQARFIRRRQRAGSAIRKFFRGFREVVRTSWLPLTGIVITIGIILFNIYTLLPAGTVSPKALAVVKSTPPIHIAPTRTIVDTSKPWTYDFSKLPDGAIDTKIFNVENGPRTANYNGESETYTKSIGNVRIQDGALTLEAKPEVRDAKTYTSGRIDTNGSFSFTYGTLEVKAKLPRGVGTWPAAWLLPANPLYKAADFPSAKDQTRLYTLNGELDFLESVGYITGQNFPAAHSYNSLVEALQYTPSFTADPYGEYHTYGIIKKSNLIEFTLDGTVYAQRVKTSNNPLSWPFNQPYYLILNLSIGGSWAGNQGIDDSSAPWDYSIQSITYTPLPS